MIETVLAAVTFAVCVALLLRLAIGPRRRSALDLRLRRLVARLRGARAALGRRWHARRDAGTAARVAAEAIQRARRRGEWEGNVYKPESFRKPPRDKMH
jgi:hypothetical protein